MRHSSDTTSRTHIRHLPRLGASYRVAGSISIFGEYNYVWPPGTTVPCGFPPATVLNQGSLHIGKVGLNYEF